MNVNIKMPNHNHITFRANAIGIII